MVVGPTPVPVLRVALLGRVRVWHSGVPVEVGPPQRQAVLAALLLAEGRAVGTASLVDAVWGERAGPKAEAALRSHVTLLRQVLEPDRQPRTPSTVIRSVPSGYVLPAETVSLDVTRFRALVRDAAEHRAAGRRVQAGQALRHGLELWIEGDGPEGGDEPGGAVAAALDGVPGPGAELARAALGAERDAAQATLDELEPPRAGTPPTEPAPPPEYGGSAPFAAATEPLVGDEAEPAPVAVERDHAGPLPPTLPLVGRDATVGRVLAALDGARTGRQGSTVLVRGHPGVGTTAIALAAAHTRAAEYPGGVAVLGREADDDAWERALDALDPREPVLLVVDGAREPRDGARGVRARERLAARGPGPAVLLVVGTHRLTRVRGRRIEVPPLSEDGAIAVFLAGLGDGRGEDEPDAVRVIVALTSGIPQIIEATAHTLAARPSWSLKEWVDDLMSNQGSWGSLARHGLGLFFTPHYDALDVGAAAVFRALGLHPWGATDVGAVAAMLAATPDRAAFHLEQLHDRGLVDSPRPSRYVVPFLLWNYARIVGLADDDPALRAGQVDRMLRWYGDALGAALATLRGESTAVFRTPDAARTWIDGDRGLLEAMRYDYATHPWGRSIGEALDAYDAVRSG